MAWNIKSSNYLSKVFSELPDEDLYGCIRNQMLINIKPRLISKQDELRCAICGIDSEVVLPRIEITEAKKMKNSALRNILDSRFKTRSNFKTLQYRKYGNTINRQTMIITCGSCSIESEIFVKKPLNLVSAYKKRNRRKKSFNENTLLNQYKRPIENEETSSNAKRQKINHGPFRKNNLTISPRRTNKTRSEKNSLRRIDENNFMDFIPLEMNNRHGSSTSPADVIEIMDSPRKGNKNGTLQTIASPSNRNGNNVIEIIDSPQKKRIGNPSNNNKNSVIEIMDSPQNGNRSDTLKKIGSPSNDNQNNVIEIIDSPMQGNRNNKLQKIGSPLNNNKNNVIEIIDSPTKKIKYDLIRKIGSPSNANENNVIDIIDSPEKNSPNNNATNIILITDSPLNNGLINLDHTNSPNSNGSNNSIIEIKDSPSSVLNENNNRVVIKDSLQTKTVTSNARHKETLRENDSNSTNSEVTQNGNKNKKKTLETYNSSKKALKGLSKLLNNNDLNPKPLTLLQGFLRTVS